jgi:hypothetical protein
MMMDNEMNSLSRIILSEPKTIALFDAIANHDYAVLEANVEVITSRNFANYFLARSPSSVVYKFWGKHPIAVTDVFFMNCASPDTMRAFLSLKRAPIVTKEAIFMSIHWFITLHQADLVETLLDTFGHWLNSQDEINDEINNEINNLFYTAIDLNNVEIYKTLYEFFKYNQDKAKPLLIRYCCLPFQRTVENTKMLEVLMDHAYIRNLDDLDPCFYAFINNPNCVYLLKTFIKKLRGFNFYQRYYEIAKTVDCHYLIMEVLIEEKLVYLGSPQVKKLLDMIDLSEEDVDALPSISTALFLSLLDRQLYGTIQKNVNKIENKALAFFICRHRKLKNIQHIILKTFPSQDKFIEEYNQLI